MARSELIGVDYSDNCGSKSTINFVAHLGEIGRVSDVATQSLLLLVDFFQRRLHH